MLTSLFAPLLSLAVLAAPADSTPAAVATPAAPPATVAVPVGATRHRVAPAAADSVRTSPIEYSDWYGRRLTIHRYASFATLPLFAFQYAAGQELLDDGDAPTWARRGHESAAGAIAGLFVVNTVTGVWNLWDARKDPAARKWRTAHAVLMLVADAGFVATGALAEEGDDEGEGGGSDGSRRHRNVAIGSMAVATVSYVMMLPPFRRD
jgi:hypothetical protein